MTYCNQDKERLVKRYHEGESAAAICLKPASQEAPVWRNL